MILGAADQRLRASSGATGVTLHEYEDDDELMLERGPAIVEGALQQAIANTRITIHGSQVAVVGHGTIGGLLARTLVLLGAHVTVVARNPVQRAAARAAGADAVPLDALPAVAARSAMLISTVPAAVVGRDALAGMAPRLARHGPRCTTRRRRPRRSGGARARGRLGARARPAGAGHGRGEPVGRHP